MKVISKAIVNVETLEKLTEKCEYSSQNQCTCVDTYCGCGA